MRGNSVFTQAVHAGEGGPRPDFSPVVTPIHNSVVYLYDRVETLHEILSGDRPGYVYSRYANPTTAALEAAVAVLEGGGSTVAFASGMAAIHAALLATGLRPGDTVVAARDLYGVTYTLLTEVMTALQVRTIFVEIARTQEAVRVLEKERPRLLLLETMSNPLLVVPDLPALAAGAHAAGARVIVDNTFSTPYLLRPLEHGADLVVHSLTKYLGGHDDVTGGAVVGRGELAEKARRLAQVLGAILGPNEAWLVHRGLKTFALRMRAHCDNASQVAAWLAGQKAVAAVHYPGLPSHPQHATASRLFRPGSFGGMVAFDLRNATPEAALGVMGRLRLILPGTTLGCVHSLILYPARTSHRGLSTEQRASWGIGEGLLRLSVGIEEPADIQADLEQALGAAS